MTEQEQLLGRFQQVFNEMESDHIPSLGSVYHDNVLFRDPLTEVRGLPALETYLSNAYANVIHCGFDYGVPAWQQLGFSLPWTMTLQHRRLRRGRPINVEGITMVHTRDNLISFHRDYFDAGQLLYEQVPVLGCAIRWLRRHAA